jgi:arylsulfatase A-like enzyme
VYRTVGRDTFARTQPIRLFKPALWIVLAYSIACAGRAGEEPARKYLAQNAIILVFDGVRYSESWGDPEHKQIPHLAEMAKEGVVYTHFMNLGVTATNPGHASLLTGVRERITNDGTESEPHPTFLQLWRKLTGAPQNAAWVVTSKGKLAILADSAAPEWKGQFTPSANSGANGEGLKAKARPDRETWEAAKTILQRDHPRAMLINLAAPDARGHAGDREGYLKAIRDADECAGELWAFLKGNAFYANKTALFVTNDHGRHLDGVKTGYKDHGCDCEGCRHIMLFAFGPDFRVGSVVDTPREQIDVAVTAAELLGVKIPDTKGQVLTELFAPRTGTTVATRPSATAAPSTPEKPREPAKTSP